MPASVSFSRIFKAFTDVRDRSGAVPRLCVVGAGPALRRVVNALSSGASDESAGVSATVDALAPQDFPSGARQAGRWDLVVLVADGTSGTAMAPVVREARRAGADVVALVEKPAGDPAGIAWIQAAGVFPDEIARSHGRHGHVPTLENRLVHAAGDEAHSLARTLPAVRRAYSDHVILMDAAQNAVIGAVVIIPGADMPAMTANQIRMVLKIAAAYGEELNVDRALEIVSVVGAAFVFRALARQALDFVPGIGWALKGAVGFSGTIALGEAAVAYFEAGAPIRVSRVQRIQRVIDRAQSRVPGFLLGRGDAG